MTEEELQALAVYRTHKHCYCSDCSCARRVLRERDEHQLRPHPSLPEEDGARIQLED
jgi:hypothetical protein